MDEIRNESKIKNFILLIQTSHVHIGIKLSLLSKFEYINIETTCKNCLNLYDIFFRLIFCVHSTNIQLSRDVHLCHTLSYDLI